LFSERCTTEFIPSLLVLLQYDKVHAERAQASLLWRKIEFYVVIPQQVWLQKMILSIGNWREFDKGFAVSELRLPSPFP
jgi:hypothetical protein